MSYILVVSLVPFSLILLSNNTEGRKFRLYVLSRVHKREGKRVSHLLNAVFVVQRSSDGLVHIVT